MALLALIFGVISAVIPLVQQIAKPDKFQGLSYFMLFAILS